MVPIVDRSAKLPQSPSRWSCRWRSSPIAGTFYARGESRGRTRGRTVASCIWTLLGTVRTGSRLSSCKVVSCLPSNLSAVRWSSLYPPAGSIWETGESGSSWATICNRSVAPFIIDSRDAYDQTRTWIAGVWFYWPPTFPRSCPISASNWATSGNSRGTPKHLLSHLPLSFWKLIFVEPLFILIRRIAFRFSEALFRILLALKIFVTFEIQLIWQLKVFTLSCQY